MTKSIETMETELNDARTRLRELRLEEVELMTKISRLEAQIFERNMDQSTEWQLVEDWTTLRPGTSAAVVVVRPADEPSFSTLGKVYQIEDTPGRTVSDGSSNVSLVGASGATLEPDENVRVKVWVKVV